MTQTELVLDTWSHLPQEVRDLTIPIVTESFRVSQDAWLRKRLMAAGDLTVARSGRTLPEPSNIRLRNTMKESRCCLRAKHGRVSE